MINFNKFLILAIAIVIIFVVSFVWWNYYSDKEENETPIGAKLEELLDSKKSQMEILGGIKTKVESGNLSSIINDLKEFEENFIKFTSESIEIEDNQFLDDLRKKEWENYNAFLELKESLTSYPQFEETMLSLESVIENSLAEEFIKGTERLIVGGQEGSSYENNNSLNLRLKLFQAQAAEKKGVIHKKVVGKSPADGKSSNWFYEAWIDLDTGNIRQEQQIGDSMEIDITNGRTKKKLALEPNKKLAEWLDNTRGKIGIGAEATVDPYSLFKKNIEEGKCFLDGTDIFENKEVYVMNCPIYSKDYSLYYISAKSYLPLRYMVFYEEHLIEPTDDPFKSNVIKTGKMEFMYDYWFVIGEIVDAESLPNDIFKQEIPEGYEIKDWVPFG